MIADDDPIGLEIIFRFLHLPDHKGMKAMYENSKIIYAGFKRERINIYVSDCITCKQHIPMKRIALITSIISRWTWDIIQMDCVDLRNFAEVNDVYGWILNIIECYSKFVYSYKLKKKTAIDIHRSFEDTVRCNVYPISVQTDNGKEFANTLFKMYLERNNVAFVRRSSRHLQNQGQVEPC